MAARASGRRFAVVLVLSLLTFWVAIGSTFSTVLATRAPESVLRIWPWSATALAARAAHGLDAQPDASALADAAGALRLDPSSVPAVRVLAIGAAGNRREARADALFEYAETLSRRDLPTEIWWIEHYVAKGDVTGALAHYDRALRTSRAAEGVLVPVLVQAFADPQVTPSIARLIARRPSWWRRFGSALLGDPANARLIPAAFAALRLDVTIPDEASLLADGISRLTQTGSIRPAFGLFRQAGRGRPDGGASLRDGGFDAAPDVPLPPFDWVLTNDADLLASVEPAPGRDGARRLEIVSQRRGGPAARQLLVLEPGRYALTFDSDAAGEDPVVAPRVTLTCAGAGDRKLVELPFASKPGSIRGTVEVPSVACSAQWLEIIVPGDGGGSEARPWIDSVAIRRGA